MGMFDKDKEIGLQMRDWIPRDIEFILWGVTGPVDVTLASGVAKQTTLDVSKLDTPGDRYRVNTLSGPIAAKAPEADPGEFPAVVQWTKVDSTQFPGQEATVLRFLKAYRGTTPDPSGDGIAAAVVQNGGTEVPAGQPPMGVQQ